MVRDELTRQALQQTNGGLVVCATPANVLLLNELPLKIVR